MLKKKKVATKATKVKVVKEKSLAKVETPSVPMSTFHSADFLIQQLSGKNVDADKMEKLLALKGKYEAEENKKRFQIKFSELQSRLPVIQKTKEVWNKEHSYVMYRYAPLEKIIEQIKPVLCELGFSYRWSEGLTEKDGYKRIYCHVMACGHEEQSFMDIPLMDANKVINKAQQAGVSSTYGKRYSLIGALGIMADEDTDGAGMDRVEKSTPKTENPKMTIARAIDSVTKKYKELCKYSNPNDALKEFIGQIELKDLQEVIGMSQKLDQLMGKKEGGK